MDPGVAAARKGSHYGDEEGCLQLNARKSAAQTHHAKIAFIRRRSSSRGNPAECHESDPHTALNSPAIGSHRQGNAGEFPQHYGLSQGLHFALICCLKIIVIKINIKFKESHFSFIVSCKYKIKDIPFS